MKNEQLNEILESYKNKSNKELANILATLQIDFNNIKTTLINLTDTLKEVEITYDAIYNELQKRLKFDSDEK